VALAKRALRSEMFALRRTLTPELRETAGARVAELLAESAEFAAAERIVMVAALASEVPTARIVEAALAAKKELLWPRAAAAGKLEVVPGGLHDGFVRDAAGVLAPPPEVRASRLAPGDLLLVPGVAFTRRGARLGRGGGYYDRLLADAAGCISVGLAFDIQLVDEIPTDSHDREVSIVVTPSGIWRNTL
jgi:5-formyltetrahydrofolate cyclo-ligase